MRVAIIPARGGSKRIPRKNLRDFCGRPIIGWSIATALSSGLFDKVIVSTDDEEIAGVATSLGALVPFRRPAALSDDHAGTLAVVRHAIQACRELGWHPHLACCLYATAPFVEAADLQRGLDALADPALLYAFSATSFAFPVQRAIRIDGHGRVSPVWPENIPRRSQDLESLYHDAGQFYWGRADAFAQELPLFAPHAAAVLMPRHRVQDIDDEEDWVRAEWLFRAWKGMKAGA
jgi:N-acylneuraminate cytidylyltransferase